MRVFFVDCNLSIICMEHANEMRTLFRTQVSYQLHAGVHCGKGGIRPLRSWSFLEYFQSYSIHKGTTFLYSSSSNRSTYSIMFTNRGGHPKQFSLKEVNVSCRGGFKQVSIDTFYHPQIYKVFFC